MHNFQSVVSALIVITDIDFVHVLIKTQQSKNTTFRLLSMSPSSGKKGQIYNHIGRLDEAPNFSVFNQIIDKVQLECRFNSHSELWSRYLGNEKLVVSCLPHHI
jgi:hypothetical protein